MKNNNLLIMVVAVVIVGVASFYGGMRYQQMKSLSGARQFMAGGANGQTFRTGFANGAGRGGAANAGMRPVVGEILNMDDKSITVKLQDGSSKIVLLPDTATYSKTATGSKSDLKVGQPIGVFGTTNADGSVTAQSVQENPSFGTNRVMMASPSSTTK